MSAEKIPGPGSYSLGSKAFSKSRFHMGIKTVDPTDKTKTPGPGAYDDKH